MGEVTVLLRAGRNEEGLAVGRIFELLYPELRRIAQVRLRYRDDRLLLDTGVLINKAYLRLLNIQSVSAADRSQFLAYAGQVMRSVVVDVERESQANRRGGGQQAFVTMDTQALNDIAPQGEDKFLRVHEVLQELEKIDERLVCVVEMRYFVGMNNQELADSLASPVALSSATGKGRGPFCATFCGSPDGLLRRHRWPEVAALSVSAQPLRVPDERCTLPSLWTVRGTAG